MKRSLVLLSSVALLASPAAAGGPSESLKAEIKSQVSILKSQVKALTKAFDADLDVLRESVKADTVAPEDAFEALFDLTAGVFADMGSAGRTATDAIETEASALLAVLEEFPQNFVVGDGGLIDKGAHKVNEELRKGTDKVRSLAHKFGKFLQKKQGYEVVADRRGPRADPMTPTAELTPADAPKAPLRIDLLMSGSTEATADGRVCLGGTADATNGSDVDVTLTLPGGVPDLLNVAVVDGRWKACFAEMAPFDLVEGNYAIEVTQGSVTISESLGVP